MKILAHTLYLILFVTVTASVAQNEYIKQYGNSPLVPASVTYPDFCPSSPDHISPANPVHLVIASDKQIKIDAVTELFARNPRFNHVKKTFHPVKVSSEIADQPIGLANGRQGALNRINNAAQWAKTQGLNNVYLCAIENYFEVDHLDAPQDHAFVMIKSPDGQLFETISVGVAIHKDIFDAAIQDAEQQPTGYSKTIGAYLQTRYKFNDSDWFNDVGAGINRVEQIAGTLSSESPWF